MTDEIKHVRKRNGNISPFDRNKIARAIERAAKSAATSLDAPALAADVVSELVKIYDGHTVPSVEQVQDAVERVLMQSAHPEVAKNYILYRQERTRIRGQKELVPEKVRQLASASKQYFKNSLAEFVYYRTYSRWIDSEHRRETWVETVQRYVDYMHIKLGDKLTPEEYSDVRESILHMDVMPSMRLLWAAGTAADKSNVCAYNCSFTVPTTWKSFGEIMYLSMCGTGVGFSVEERFVDQLPKIKAQTGEELPAHLIGDSKEGWADALVVGMSAWAEGKEIAFDYSNIRPRGARLRVMGGRSSGPEPLRSALEFTHAKMLAKQGMKLSPIDVHDIICKVGEVVVMGGVRRSALISLSDLKDIEMRTAKTGHFYQTEPQRSMANNSAVYAQKPSSIEFLEEWTALIASGSGERGIFNRGGLKAQMPERRLKICEKQLNTMGTNPCGEIILRPNSFCNLTEVVARSNDTRDVLLEKIRVATIIGTFQATLTDFPYLSKKWKENCEEERLLGVSITGQWDCPAVRNSETLSEMRSLAVQTNKIYAERFGINQSASVTCVKPSGTVSQLVDASSGMHPRHSKYYIRRVRISATDSLFKMLKDQKVPYQVEVGQTIDTAATFVLEFPIKAPDSTETFRNDVTAIQQLEHWLQVKANFTEHNPSVTVSVGDDEWIQVAAWLQTYWDLVGGLSFLPRYNHVYPLAPYEEITKEKYEELASAFPDIDFSQILLYEKDDETQGAKELACSAGSCELK